MKYIQLTQGKQAIVDDEDFEYLNQWKWYYCNGYAMRNKENKKGLIRMHRIINKTPENLFTDHINMNKIDNRKSNLRAVNKSLNEHNTTKRKNNTSGYKGVSFDKAKNKWKSEIMINRRKMFLGYFLKPEDAYLKYLKIERSHYAI